MPFSLLSQIEDAPPHGRYHTVRLLWFRKYALPPPARTLDVGCGHFQLLEMVDGDAGEDLIFHCDGHGCVGLDVNKEYYEEACRVRPNDELLYCDVGVDRFPVDDDAFENVICGEIIEHLPLEQWPHFLNECLRATKYQILVSAPAWHVDEDRAFPPGPTPETHRFEASWNTFRREITKVVDNKARRIEFEMLTGFMYCRIYKRDISFV